MWLSCWRKFGLQSAHGELTLTVIVRKHNSTMSLSIFLSKSFLLCSLVFVSYILLPTQPSGNYQYAEILLVLLQVQFMTHFRLCGEVLLVSSSGPVHDALPPLRWKVMAWTVFVRRRHLENQFVTKSTKVQTVWLNLKLTDFYGDLFFTAYSAAPPTL